MNDVTFDVVNNLAENGQCVVYKKGSKEVCCVIVREDTGAAFSYAIHGSDGEELLSGLSYIPGITDAALYAVNQRLACTRFDPEDSFDLLYFDLETLESDARYELAENELWLMSKSIPEYLKEDAILALMRYYKHGEIKLDVLVRQWSKYQPKGQEQELLRYDSWLRALHNVLKIDRTFPDEYAVCAVTDKYAGLYKNDTYELLDIETFQPVLSDEYTIDRIWTNFARIKRGGKYGLVVLADVKIGGIPCEYDFLGYSSVILSWGGERVNNALWAEKNEKWGLINAYTGEFIVPLQYDDIGEQNPFTMNTPVKRNGKWGWIAPRDATAEGKKCTVGRWNNEEREDLIALCADYGEYEEWLEADIEGIKETRFNEIIPLDFGTDGSYAAVRAGKLWGLLKQVEGKTFPTFVLTEPLREQLWLPPEQCQSAVRQNGKALRFVPENLKTAELCLAAVRENGHALQFVPEALKTVELCRAADQNSEVDLDGKKTIVK